MYAFAVPISQESSAPREANLEPLASKAATPYREVHPMVPNCWKINDLGTVAVVHSLGTAGALAHARLKNARRVGERNLCGHRPKRIWRCRTSRRQLATTRWRLRCGSEEWLVLSRSAE